MAKLCIVAAVLTVFIAVTQTGRLVGGKTDVNVNEDGVKRALRFAENEYNKRSNDMYESRVTKVERAQRQIVSGILYSMDLEIARTQCRKPTTDINNCAFHTDPATAKSTLCHFEVTTVPWKTITELIKMDCN